MDIHQVLRISAFILLPLYFSGCSQDVTEKEKPVRPVISVIAGEANSDHVKSYPGKISAAEQVDLAFQVPGRLIAMPITKGLLIKAGTLLAKLDTRDYESNLKAAKANYERASADFSRAEELVKRQLLSRSDFDTKKAQKDIAEADIDKARKALTDATLTAPFDGVIANTFVDNFQDINAKQPIMSLQGGSGLDVLVNIPENIVINYNESRRKKVIAVATFDALPEREFPLALKEFSQEVDPSTQTYEVVMRMDKPAKELSILPGMSVTVEIKIPEEDASKEIFIPATALFGDRAGEKGQYIWVIDPDTMTVSSRKVTIGRLKDDRVQIQLGIQSGERVVTAGVHYLNEGDKVRLYQDETGA